MLCMNRFCNSFTALSRMTKVQWLSSLKQIFLVDRAVKMVFQMHSCAYFLHVLKNRGSAHSWIEVVPILGQR